jgi:Fe-S oxidoreductase
MFRKYAEGEIEITEPMRGEFWDCTTCKECELSCPAELKIIDLVLAMRRIFIDEGHIPRTAARALESTYTYGNPGKEVRSARADWAKGLGVKEFSEGARAEMLLYIGCTPSYDLRVLKVAQALALVLHKAEVDFAILGGEEMCCGNEVYRMGEEGLFEFLVESNMKLFQKYGVSKIVTISPHCYNTFKNEYPLHIGVEHYTQHIAGLLATGKLKPSGEIGKRVTYHDPCYLGRHNGVYEQPRQLLQGIPGLELVEMERNRETSLCCEGGGGRMWLEASTPGPRLAESIVRDAIAMGAEIIATSCPFCLLNIEDAIKATGYEAEIRVYDVIELVAQSLFNKRA